MKKIGNYLGRNFKRKRIKDKLPILRRSILMSGIRSRDTKFEKDFILSLRKITRKKFKINVHTIKGKPDIVFYKNKLILFLDSDFWHGWYYPKWKHLLKDNFWRTKIENNRLRDRKITNYLRRTGWKVVRIWEHEIKKSPKSIINKIIGALEKSQ